MPQLRAQLAIFSLLLISAAAQSQTPSPTPTSPLQPQAYKLLENIAERVPTLRSRHNRGLVGSEIADLIWDKDEKRGRALFDDVARDFSEMFTGFDITNDPGNEFHLLNQLRHQIIERLARHDPNQALTFLRSTRNPADPRLSPDSSNELNLEVQLASQIASRDPELALRIARASLAKGVTHNIQNVLVNLHQKDPKLAHAFHKDILERFSAADMEQSQESLNILATLMTSFQPPKAEEETYRQIANVVLDRMLAASPSDPAKMSTAQNLYYQVNNLLAQIEKYLPVRVAAFNRWRSAVERTFDVNAQRYHQMNELTQKSTPEEIIAAASKFPEEMKLQVHQNAIWKALSNGDHEKARQLANDLITDPVRRAQMLTQIDTTLLWKAVTENKVVEARRLLVSIKDPEQRLQILGQLAANVGAKGDKKTALALLDEARAGIEALPPNSQKLNGQVQLARYYADMDSDLSESLLQAVIAQMNQLVAAAVTLDGFENQYLRESEWQPQNYSGVGNILNNLQQALAAYANRKPAPNDTQSADASVKRFSIASDLAEKFERPEIRLQAQLQLVRAVLTAPQNASSIRISTGRRVFIAH